MRDRSLLPLLVAAVTSGCAASAEPRHAAPASPGPPAVAIVREEAPRLARERVIADGRARRDVEARLRRDVGEAAEEGSPRTVDLPEGVTCSVRGGGSPFPDRCDPPEVSAFATRRGGRAIASFSYQEVDVVWGFFRDAGRTFVDVRSGGLELRAYTDASRVLFQLARDVEILAGHVWLDEDAPVRVAGAIEDGVHVRVDDDVRGVDEIFAPVECRDVRFDTAEPRPFTRVSRPSTTVGRRELAFAKHDTLRLFTAPGGLPITTLRDSDARPLPRALDVIDTTPGFTRVAFETRHARFDAWVSDKQITRDGGGFGTSGGSGCGRSVDYVSSRRSSVLADTHVRVGAYPIGEEETALTIARGTLVVAGDRRDGFVAVFVRSEITPPEGQQFWIPASALSEPTHD